MNVTTARAGLTAALALALGTVLATPASAAETPQDCGYFVDTGTTICVPAGEDLHEAVLEQTGQTIVVSDDAGTASRAASPASADGVASPATSYLVARLYDDINYGGSYDEIYASGPCASGTTWYVNDVGSGWYGRVSSIRGYSSCRVQIFSAVNQGGSSYGPVASSAWVGDAMNDQTRSVKLVY